MTRDQLVKIFGALAAPASAEDAIASYMIGRVDSLSNRQDRVDFTAMALQAYAKLLQDNGVKVV